jgi:uncharacterized protein
VASSSPKPPSLLRFANAVLLLGVSYAALAGAAYVTEVIFGVAGLVPQQHSAQIVEAHITWNYTTWLNIVFLGLAALRVWRS